jgi:hypothetical protein
MIKSQKLQSRIIKIKCNLSKGILSLFLLILLGPLRRFFTAVQMQVLI